LVINYGVSLDNLIINSFTENIMFVENVYKGIENNSLNLFVDFNYAFEFLGFIGELDMGISNNKSMDSFGFEDRGFVYPANQSQNYFEGELKFFKGPFFLSIDKQNNNDPTVNIGFNYLVN